MEIFPKTLGTRPRLAIELRAEGVVAARAEDASAVLTAVSKIALPEGVLAAGLKPGNIVDHARIVAAVREAVEALSGRGGDRGRNVTRVVPDAAVRVLLLDFDELPGKAIDALPVIRFRLKKLLPFDADTAAMSYQVMSTERNMVRVLAVAMPHEVRDEYETVVTAAGFVAGAVLPSTLASLGCLDEQEGPALVVNADYGNVTTAIVRGGVVLLHRTLEMAAERGRVASAEDGSVLRELEYSRGYDRSGHDRTALVTQVLESASEAAMDAREIAQSVSVATAYFEDTLAVSPEVVLSAGTLGAERITFILDENGLAGLRVQEMVAADAMVAGVSTTRVPRGWLAGVRGALRN